MLGVDFRPTIDALILHALNHFLLWMGIPCCQDSKRSDISDWPMGLLTFSEIYIERFHFFFISDLVDSPAGVCPEV